ncbi:capsule associated protein [Lasiosphaeria ovina]|uniref:Capsule associated protein n=1 Tax=Lasiosphaeria ovina TaxID=92902 RepID=A0AAE0TU76_9PEZI|nr:capsule associated protein [Lasiosphaeria ovina]
MRSRHLVGVTALLFFAVCLYSFSRSRSTHNLGGLHTTPLSANRNPNPRPKPAPASSHPIWHLINNAERDFEAAKARQSRTLSQAVAEYRRRYGLPPPPNFDKWWAFAKSKNVQLVDEFDTIADLLTPFWGLKPATIRARAKEVLGFPNAVMGVAIRGANVSHIAGGLEWQQDATRGMIEPFLQFLPDMDLAFNCNDEPRVVVPHDDMSRLVHIARTVNIPAASSMRRLRNEFTKSPEGLNDGLRFDETKLTRFNEFAHQPTWTHSRSSCPPESPARVLDDADRVDDVSKYGLSELGFVYNATAMSDICLTPSLSETFGFFDRPNAYSVVHDLFPIFSQSKISSYNDIIYPSPWYWADRVEYKEGKDPAWANKKDQLFWRGSTTGGYSRNGGWRRQHRQGVVRKLNAGDQAKVLTNEGSETSQRWAVKEVPRGEYKQVMDVHFSHIGQCDQGDCDAQKDFFGLEDRVDQEVPYQYKYVLDLDGNAFSGRFYGLLRSRSLVYKFSIFREWHAEWLRPWAHYIPMSLQGDDWLEAVRYFTDSTLGKKEAERVAIQSRDWANKVIRREDMEAWFFRLLLEYGRVIDDNRESIGFT